MNKDDLNTTQNTEEDSVIEKNAVSNDTAIMDESVGVLKNESENLIDENKQQDESVEIVDENRQMNEQEVMEAILNLPTSEPKPKKYKMKKPKSIRTKKLFGSITSTLLIVLIIMCAFFGGYTTSALLQSEDAAVAEWLVQVLNDDAYYADYAGLDAAFLMEYGLSFCLREDPYCNLMSPEETAAYYETASGSSTSFGVSVGTYEGIEGVYVISVVMGSSAQKEGLSEGMRILTIDGIDLYESDMDDVSSILLGKEENDTAEIVCILPSINGDNISYSRDNETFTATIVKEVYTPLVVEYYDNQTAGLEELADTTAYIKITSFVGKTDEQFTQAMEWYQETGKENLILDLRDNTGGSEENMRAVGSYLLKAEDEDQNPLIITIQDKYGDVEEVRAYGSYYEEMNFEHIIVLVNSSTASASEAILTAMMDYDTVDIVIGETTYGKGTGLLTTYMPVYGYSVTFTSTYYFSPYGNSHDQIGLSPTNGYSMVDSTSYPYSYDGDSILQRAINALK